MYKKILVAIDDSEFSRAAVIESANLIKKHGGELTLLHVVYFDEEEFSASPAQQEKRVEIGKEICRKAGAMVSSEYGIQAKTVVREGDPPKVIAEQSAELGIDLIAIGTYGKKGLKKLIMGSVSSNVIGESPCDVLVVKKACTECTGTYSSILMPFDGSVSSKKALVRACRIAQADNARLTVLYSIPRYEEMIGFFKSESIKESLREEAEKLLSGAESIASEHGVTIEKETAEGYASDRIVETAAGSDIDLIVIGTHGWRGVNKVIMGSTTERVLVNATIPVLAVR